MPTSAEAKTVTVKGVEAELLPGARSASMVEIELLNVNEWVEGCVQRIVHTSSTTWSTLTGTCGMEVGTLLGVAVQPAGAIPWLEMETSMGPAGPLLWMILLRVTSTFSFTLICVGGLTRDWLMIFTSVLSTTLKEGKKRNISLFARLGSSIWGSLGSIRL